MSNGDDVSDLGLLLVRGAQFGSGIRLPDVRSTIPPEGLRFEPPLGFFEPAVAGVVPLIAIAPPLPTVPPPIPTVPPPLPGVPPQIRPVGATTRAIFPAGRAANEPFRSAASAALRIIRVGGVVVGVVQIAADLARLFQEQRIEQLVVDLDLELETKLSRAAMARARERPVVTLPPQVLAQPVGIAEVIASAPRPRVTPRSPSTVERPQSVDVPLEIPVPPQPVIVAPTVPTPNLPTSLPTPSPVASPVPFGFGVPRPLPQVRGIFPFRFALPFRLPRRFIVHFPQIFPSLDPQIQPIADPAPFVIGDPLTPVESDVPQSLVPTTGGVGTIELPTPQPVAQAQNCQVVQRRRRKKGRCREGFFRESATGTKFVTWRERPCGASARKTAGNVIDLFGG